MTDLVQKYRNVLLKILCILVATGKQMAWTSGSNIHTVLYVSVLRTLTPSIFLVLNIEILVMHTTVIIKNV